MELQYIIHYDIAALIITITVFLHFFFKKTINTQQTHLFAVLIVLAFISNVADFITIFTISYPGSVPRWFNYIVNMCYLITFNGTPVAYLRYIIAATRKKEQAISLVDSMHVWLPITALVLLVLTTPWTRLVFFFDENCNYIHGKLFLYLYLCALYYVAFAFIRTMRYRRKLTRSQIITVSFFTLSSFFSVVLQMLISELLITQFMVAISILLIYLCLENPEDYNDKMLGTYNNIAFMEVFEVKTKTERRFTILGVRVEGLGYINDNMGMSAGNELMKTIAEFLMQIAQKKSVYHMSGAQFIILGQGELDEWEYMINQIKARFKRPFLSAGVELTLSVRMCKLTYPDTVQKLQDAMDMIDYTLKEANTGDVIVYADKDILEKGRRENLLLDVIKKAIRKNAFEVYYQPIYSLKNDAYTTAEALIRLRTEELGFISPEEFIPLAEKNGLIIEIGEVIFEKVCRFFKENELDRKGIEYIHVNLSVVECMQEHLSEKLLQILDMVGLEYSFVRLEITETAAVVSKDILKNNMNRLLEKGIQFAMDDYGTGFSNTATIINYPFSDIKLDKSMIWSAMEDEKAMVALKHSVAMFKELNLEIIAEGVETKEQEECLRKMGCDYIQGYLHSKPVDEATFLTLI